MPPKLFTPMTARKALDRLRADAEAMRRLFRTMEHKSAGGRRRPDQPVDRGYLAMVFRFHLAVAALSRAGVLVKDPREGLLDFPARRDGRPVFLCWKVGEREIRYWHEVDGGFIGRKPVDEEGPWEGGEAPLDNPV